ncbi:CPBP family intramembrane glutamic endopeptidase [Chryseobacterium sediminis]|uniref:CPBP family intramembrane metalloprotease n=1 Tax=Chryseobacterium sediminis TaxID=1679494 RepID=A0A5B2U348_9FLAO|nr:type II CAAX endopeptidase family protein [Chryseobacterium sediminis]KAA2220720.1 CPBP family intramembrane metalloprotease [Chryseobacterium sediminis]
MKNTWIYFKIILFYLLSMLLFAFSNAICKTWKFPELFSLIFATVLTCGLIYIFIRWDKISLTQIGLGGKKSWISKFCIGVCIGVVVVGIMTLIITNLTDIVFKRSPKFQPGQFALYIPLFLFVALREELTFRTYMLWRLNDKIGPILSLTCVTMVFIAEHMIAGLTLKNALIGSGLGALLFGIATLRTGNIALSTGLHFAWNSAHWMFGFKDNTGLFIETVAKGNESQGEIVAYMAYTAVMLLGIVAVILISKPFQHTR